MHTLAPMTSFRLQIIRPELALYRFFESMTSAVVVAEPSKTAVVTHTSGLYTGKEKRVPRRARGTIYHRFVLTCCAVSLITFCFTNTQSQFPEMLRERVINNPHMPKRWAFKQRSTRPWMATNLDTSTCPHPDAIKRRLQAEER